MPLRILVGYDGTEPSVRALEFVSELFQHGSDSLPSEIHLAYILEKPAGIADPMPEEANDSLRRVAEEILLNGSRIVKRKFGNPITHLDSGSPPLKLLELADRLKPDLIVVGVAKHSVSERILGTVSTHLFIARKYPILAVP